MNENTENIDNQNLQEPQELEKILYSKSSNSFYSSHINDEIPEDAVEIDKELYQELLYKANNGYELYGDENGYPVLKKWQPSPELIKQVYQQELSVFINQQAIDLGFSSFSDALTYIDDPDTEKSELAKKLRQWRFEVNKAFKEMEDQATSIDEKDVQAFFDLLPKFPS